MFRNLDDQIQQTNRRHRNSTLQVLGVLGEEEYFARQEAERGRELANERQANLLADGGKRPASWGGC
jgi:hypothetical protein